MNDLAPLDESNFKIRKRSICCIKIIFTAIHNVLGRRFYNYIHLCGDLVT